MHSLLSARLALLRTNAGCGLRRATKRICMVTIAPSYATVAWLLGSGAHVTCSNTKKVFVR